MSSFVDPRSSVLFFFFNDTATTEIYTLSLHDALPIRPRLRFCGKYMPCRASDILRCSTISAKRLLGPMASRTRRPPLTVKPIVQVLPLKYTVPRPLAMTHHLAARHHAQTIHPNKARLTIQTEVIARL